jgi:biotin transport system substrate-specific component
MNIKRLTMIPMFTAMIAVSIYVLPNFIIPVVLVPFTLQLMIIMFISYTLKPIDAFLSIFLYVVLGAIGLPIFSGFRGGLNVLFGPTGGFIMLFPVIGFLISHFKSNSQNKKRDLAVGFIFGIIVLYLGANLWLSIVLDLNYINSLLALLIFIPFDILKLLLAYYIYLRIPKEIFKW